MRSSNRGWAAACGGALLLAACAGGGDEVPRPTKPQQGQGVADFPVKIGPPYQVGGKTYVPEDAPNYDEVGYATWYGEEMGGADTASGEAFVPQGISAAHRTLPLPSYVEVTSLDSGRTILVRVNDRGPFGEGKIIDLSRGAAEQLGVLGGPAAVRVRRVNPPEQERAALRAHGRAVERLETPAPLLAVLRKRMGMPGVAPAKPAAKGKAAKAKAARPVQPGASYATPVAPAARNDGGFVVEQAGRKFAPVPATSRGGGYVVQVAAFGSKERAQALARQIGASAVEGNGGIWRVRFGPYPSEQAAQAGVRAAAAKGYADARIMNAD